MQTVCLRTFLGVSVVCFGAGILLAFLLPGFILAFLESAVMVTAGVLLLRRH